VGVFVFKDGASSSNVVFAPSLLNMDPDSGLILPFTGYRVVVPFGFTHYVFGVTLNLGLDTLTGDFVARYWASGLCSGWIGYWRVLPPRFEGQLARTVDVAFSGMRLGAIMQFQFCFEEMRYRLYRIDRFQLANAPAFDDYFEIKLTYIPAVFMQRAWIPRKPRRRGNKRASYNHWRKSAVPDWHHAGEQLVQY
jgi:hypothetical protein